MRLEHEFGVPVPVDEAWRVLLDIERVAPCLPGASVTQVEGDTVTGTVKVKVGPVTVTYRGTATFEEKDEDAHRVVLTGTGKETRGAGTARATVTGTLTPQEGDGEAGTRVTVVTDLTVTGRPAQFGRGVMAEVGGKLVAQFAACLSERLAGGGTDAGGTTAATGGTTGTGTGGGTPSGAPDSLGSADQTEAAGQSAATGSDAATGSGATGSGAAAGPAGAATPGAGGRVGLAAPNSRTPTAQAEPATQAAPATPTAQASPATPTAQAAPATPTAQAAPATPTAQAAPPPTPFPATEAEPIDLFGTAGLPVLKRLAAGVGMLLTAAAAVALAVRLLRRRH